MLLADATKATAESHWWEDWPKFLPGWLAFAWTLGIGARKVFLRRHHLALGPEADELRTQLTTTRALLEEVTSGKTGADWFMHEDRRETARGLRDAAERRDDPALKLSLTRVAGTWDEIFALAPPPRPRVRWVVANQDDVPERPKAAARSAADLDRIQKMSDRAHEAMLDVQSALSRLNELERRTHGR